MPFTIDVHDINNNKTEQIQLEKKYFASEAKHQLMHSAVVRYMTNKRKGASSTKDKSEVRGTGSKPWRQKGTGRARAGTLRSPLRRGGGVTFGPKPREYKNNLTKKERQAALISALSLKVNENNFIIVDKIALDQPKTKQLISIIKQFNLDGNILFLISGENRNLELAARNLKGIDVIYINSLNTYKVLYYDKIITTKEAAIELNKKFAKD